MHMEGIVIFFVNYVIKKERSKPFLCRALSAFDGHEFSETREHLELVPGALLLDLDDMGTSGAIWHQTSGIQQTEKLLLRFITYCMTTENIESKM